MTSLAEERKKSAKKQQPSKRARHRLESIQHDYLQIVQPIIAQYPMVPIVCNERCGTWYMPSPSFSSYFKSTDGHVWNFSLKRLNLHIIQLFNQSENGSETDTDTVLVLDASKTKDMPDSFSLTIPIWCAILNRIVLKYRQDMGLPPLDSWDTNLYTPPSIISTEKHASISSVLDERLELLYNSHAVVDPMWLVTTLKRPLRPFWITNPHHQTIIDDSLYFRIICVNCSTQQQKEYSSWYTPGAADDHELWSRKLTPRLFWDNIDSILTSSSSSTDDDVDAAIDRIVIKNQLATNTNHDETHELNSNVVHGTGNDFDAIAETGLYIGTRRVGRPPQCWDTFDAILNVTEMEYPTMNIVPDEKWYLQLNVQEGKRDKKELERWMAVGIVYCLFHLQMNRRVLIHCAQGKDRSVAMAMAVLIFSCDLHYPLQRKEEYFTLEDIMGQTNVTFVDDDTLYLNSGLSTRLVETLLDRHGRTLLLDWYRAVHALAPDQPVATKDTIRIALHLLQQYREKADPSRSTLQKLHRFFMSSDFEKERQA